MYPFGIEKEFMDKAKKEVNKVGKDFISEFNKKLTVFENKLSDQILELFRVNNELTTYDIIWSLESRNTEFSKLYRNSGTKARYRVRKILEIMGNNGLLEKNPSGNKVENLYFLSYKWSRINKSICKRCGKPFKEHYSGWWMVCDGGRGKM